MKKELLFEPTLQSLDFRFDFLGISSGSGSFFVFFLSNYTLFKYN